MRTKAKRYYRTTDPRVVGREGITAYAATLNGMDIDALAREWIRLQDEIATAGTEGGKHSLPEAGTIARQVRINELRTLNRKNDLLLALARTKFEDVDWLNAVDAAC